MSLRQVGEDLGVDAVVRASVRRERDRLRISARLVDAESGVNIWADDYETTGEDAAALFRIQGEIATNVAMALGAELDPEQRDRAMRIPTTNLDAWVYTERARQILATASDPEARSRVLELTQRALTLDPQFAPAHAMRAWHFSREARTFGYTTSWIDSQAVSAELALAYDHEYAFARTMMGFVFDRRGQDAKCLEFLVKAVEANPNHPDVLRGMMWFYGDRSRFYKRELWRALVRRVDPDPLGIEKYPDAGWLHWMLGDFAMAEESYRRALTLNPEQVHSRNRLAQIYLSQGLVEKAEAEVRSALVEAPDDPVIIITAGLVALTRQDYLAARTHFRRVLNFDPPVQMSLTTGTVPATALAYTWWKTGQRERAEQLLERSLELDHETVRVAGNPLKHAHYDLARVHAIRGNVDAAIRWLSAAIEGDWPFAYTYMGLSDPMLENLRGNAEFDRLMADLRADLDAQRERLQQMPPSPGEGEFQEALREARADLERLRAGERIN